MFFKKNQYRVVERSRLWYLETPTGYEGPFDTEAEATAFTKIRKCADFARLELVDLNEEYI